MSSAAFWATGPAFSPASAASSAAFAPTSRTTGAACVASLLDHRLELGEPLARLRAGVARGRLGLGPGEAVVCIGAHLGASRRSSLSVMGFSSRLGEPPNAIVRRVDGRLSG